MSERGRHHVAHDLLAELHDAADDRDLLALADALQLALAQQILNGVALGGDAGFLTVAHERPRDRGSGGDDRTQ